MSKLKTQYIQMTNEEIALLSTLMRMSRDDPRVHGLIGTCFWSHAHSKDEESKLKSLWTSIEEKLAEFSKDEA